jgi:rhodanese-related sulfurtransferase
MVKSVTPVEFAALGPDVALVDVREPAELATVRTERAQLMPMSTFMDHLVELPPDPIYLLCHSGARSARVAAYLEQEGHDAINIEGGIVEWEAVGLPVVRD